MQKKNRVHVVCRVMQIMCVVALSRLYTFMLEFRMKYRFEHFIVQDKRSSFDLGIVRNGKNNVAEVMISIIYRRSYQITYIS